MSIFSLPGSRSIKLNSGRRSSLSHFSRSDTADYGSLLWTFDPDNHFLPLEVSRFVYHKWTIRILAITVAIFLLLTFVREPSWLRDAYYILVGVMFWIPLFVLFILSMNRDAPGFIVKSSEFWIKVVYGFASPLLEVIHFHHIERFLVFEKADYIIWMKYASLILKMFINLLVMFILGGTDAMPKLQYKWKGTLIGMLAVLFSFYALENQFLKPENEDYIVRIEATGSAVSFHSLRANVCGMLDFFLWKLVLEVVRNKSRCIGIAYKPYLRWESMSDARESVDSIEPAAVDSVNVGYCS